MSIQKYSLESLNCLINHKNPILINNMSMFSRADGIRKSDWDQSTYTRYNLLNDALN